MHLVFSHKATSFLVRTLLRAQTPQLKHEPQWSQGKKTLLWSRHGAWIQTYDLRNSKQTRPFWHRNLQFLTKFYYKPSTVITCIININIQYIRLPVHSIPINIRKWYQSQSIHENNTMCSKTDQNHGINSINLVNVWCVCGRQAFLISFIGVFFSKKITVIVL